MVTGGRAFSKPFPIELGSNGAMVRYGISTTDLNQAVSIGMKWYRNDIPWTVNEGGATPIEGLPGVYSSANITNVLNVVNAVKTAGLLPLMVITAAQNPGLCPTLSSALVSGTVYTSISVTQLAFAITSGDSITLTDPSNQSNTQTVVAGASMAIGASGALAVTSFTANNSYPIGAWVYDTAWVACTPQHFADMMTHLVTQPGLQGLHWELFNEPDGPAWGITPTLLTQAYSRAYPAMKAADPTCVIHGLVLESLSPVNFLNGTYYYNAAVAAGVLPFMDVGSYHTYFTSSIGGGDTAPDSYAGADPRPGWLKIAQFQANRIAKGDTTPMWITEFGWQNTGDGSMTPQQQAQFYQNLLVTLSGNDPINNVPFSSYLKVMCQFAMEASGANWGILGLSAVGVLTQLVAGN